jgi:hypothetical protein
MYAEYLRPMLVANENRPHSSLPKNCMANKPSMSRKYCDVHRLKKTMDVD